MSLLFDRQIKGGEILVSSQADAPLCVSWLSSGVIPAGKPFFPPGYESDALQTTLLHPLPCGIVIVFLC